jgi:hypothetical protein
MIVEHTFVSTLEVAACEQRTRDLLQACGFREEAATSGGLEFRRGAKSPNKARRPDDVPQSVRVEFDRGRVVFAASLTPLRRPLPEQKDVLLLIANTLESFLTQNLELAEVLRPWIALSDRIANQQRRRKRIQHTFVAALLLLLVALVVLLVYALGQ